jgi:hypothetical protein
MEPMPESETIKIPTMPDLSPAPAAVPRRRYYEANDGGAKIWVVAPTMARALLLLADLDLDDAERLVITRLTADQARAVSFRSIDESPADNLADAPMGAVYSTEV